MATASNANCAEESSNLTPIMIYPRYVFAPAITPPSSPVNKTHHEHVTPERRPCRVPDVHRAVIYHRHCQQNADEGNVSFTDNFGLPTCESTPCKKAPSGATKANSAPSTPVTTPCSRVSNLTSQSPSSSITVNTTGYVSASPNSSSEVSTSTPDSSASYQKGGRTTYTTEQVRILEKAFFQDPYPEPETIENLSRDIKVPESKIKVWFQNKRARSRRRVPIHVSPLMATSFIPTPPVSPSASPVPIIQPPAAYYSSHPRMMHAGSYMPTSPLPFGHFTTPGLGMYTFQHPMLPFYNNIRTDQSLPLYLPQSTQCLYPTC